MSSGVVIFWFGLGAAIAFISEFTAANQLFQYPAFTISVGAVIAAMAVGMCGLFTVQLPQWVYKINPKQDSLHGSFGFGVMTAILSTPCTAPFMGGGAAWAATRHPFVTLSTFAAIGIGMALPYFLLSLFPKLVDRMPRTGPGSELLKQMMGLLMLAAAAYFIGTGLSGVLVSPPDPPSRFYWWVVSGTIALAGLWLVAQSVRLFKQKPKGIVLIVLGLLITGSGLMLGNRLTAHGPIDWVYYTPERFADAQQAQKAVVLEFTAEWCLNCHALEQAVLHSPRIVDLLRQEQVVPIKVDLTGNNTEGNQKLVDIGNRTIPLIVVYDRQGGEVFRSDAYTVDQLAKAIQKAVDLK